jgi:hypothetical protein
MSLYKNIKQIYCNLKYKNSKEEQEFINNYLKEFKDRYGDILFEKSLHTIDKTLLIYSNHNTTYSMNLESIIAKKIQLVYGWRVVFLCTIETISLAKKICNDIYGFDNFILIEDYMPFISIPELSEYLDMVDNAVALREIEHIKYNDIPIGVHSIASYSTTMPDATIILNDNSRNKIKKILKKSMRYVIASKQIVEKYKPDLVISIEKGTVGTCELFYSAINNNIDYIQYSSCHEPDSVMLKRYNKQNKRMHPFSVSDKNWDGIKYKEYMAPKVREYFKNGYKKGDWFKYKNLSANKRIVEKDELVKILKLDKRKKNVIIFSHILNDANFFYGKDIFEGGFRDWLVKTVEVASKNDKVNWLIKLHPANVFRRENQGYTGEFGEIIAIKEYLGEVPKNIKIIPADIDINPYSFFMLADYGITVRGTVGAELPCFGIPVLTAGSGRYSNKGFTIDSETKEEYLKKVQNIDLLKKLSSEQINLANKHAYLFFKYRPTKYDGFIKDNYSGKKSVIIKRDVEVVDDHIWDNESLKNIVSFFIESSEDDYLNAD